MTLLTFSLRRYLHLLWRMCMCDVSLSLLLIIYLTTLCDLISFDCFGLKGDRITYTFWCWALRALVLELLRSMRFIWAAIHEILYLVIIKMSSNVYIGVHVLNENNGWGWTFSDLLNKHINYLSSKMFTILFFIFWGLHSITSPRSLLSFTMKNNLLLLVEEFLMPVILLIQMLILLKFFRIVPIPVSVLLSIIIVVTSEVWQIFMFFLVSISWPSLIIPILFFFIAILFLNKIHRSAPLIFFRILFGKFII